MKKYRPFIVVALLGLLPLLHFLPIKQSSGVIEANPGGAVTCEGYATETRNFRVIANGAQRYQETRDAFATNTDNKLCGYRPVKLKLFIF